MAASNNAPTFCSTPQDPVTCTANETPALRFEDYNFGDASVDEEEHSSGQYARFHGRECSMAFLFSRVHVCLDHTYYIASPKRSALLQHIEEMDCLQAYAVPAVSSFRSREDDHEFTMFGAIEGIAQSLQNAEHHDSLSSNAGTPAPRRSARPRAMKVNGPRFPAWEFETDLPAESAEKLSEPPTKKRKVDAVKENALTDEATEWLILPGANEDVPEVYDEASADALLTAPIRYLGPCDDDVREVELALVAYQEKCFTAMSQLPPNATKEQIKQMQEFVKAMQKGRFSVAHVKAVAYKIPGAIIKIYKDGLPFTGDIDYGKGNTLDCTEHSCSKHLGYVIKALYTCKRVCKTLMEQKDFWKIMSAPNTVIGLKCRYSQNNQRRSVKSIAAKQNASAARFEAGLPETESPPQSMPLPGLPEHPFSFIQQYDLSDSSRNVLVNLNRCKGGSATGLNGILPSIKLVTHKLAEE